MSDMTPDELRKWASEASRRDDDKDISDALFIAADAWEFKVWQVEQVVVAKNETIADLRKRLEAAERCEAELTRQWQSQRLELVALRKRLEAAKDALRWMVNVANDVGKAGGKPYTDEWKDATDAGMIALAGEE